MPGAAPSAPVRIAPLQSEDVVPIGGLIRSVISRSPYYNEAAIRHEQAKYTSERIRERLHDDPDALLIAWTAGRPVGFCVSRDEGGVRWMSWVGVCDAMRRRGIASRLICELERRIRERGCHKIWFDCRTTHTPTKAMARRLGFQIACTLKNHWHGLDYHLWEKALEPRA